MAFGIDRETFTSPLTLLALTGVAFGSMSMVVVRDASSGNGPAAAVAPTTTLAPAAVSVGGPSTTLGDSTAPLLTLANAGAGVVEAPEVVLEGTSEPDAVIAVGFSTTVADAFGAWRLSVVLTEGSNTLTVAATDHAGNQTLAVQVLTYAPPVPTTVAPEVTALPTTEVPATTTTDAPVTSTTVRRSTPTPPPATSPPATSPPATSPPATSPPATSPPATLPQDVEDGSD